MNFSPFTFGIDGTKKLESSSVRLLKATQPCGIILFAKNIKNPSQVKGLVHHAQDILGRKLLVMIDHEGGLICRFSQGVTHFPGNFALGKTGNASYAYRVGQIMAEELLAMGINTNLAPVLDVLVQGYNPGITVRSFGSDPKLVAKLGKAIIQGMQDNGLSATAKHFPGKGAATLDAHNTLPTLRQSKKVFSDRDLLPFKAAIKAGVDLVMTSHIRCPALDWRKIPATFSKKVVTNLLKTDLGFSGVTITDDLGMGAITERATAGQASVLAAKAGHDILLVCLKNYKEAYTVYQKARDGGEITDGAHEESLQRIRRLLNKHEKYPQLLYSSLRASSEAISSKKNPLARTIARKSVAIVRKGQLILPIQNSSEPILCLVPDLSTLKNRFVFEPGLENLPQFIDNALKKRKIKARVITTRLDQETLPLPPTTDPIVFFCFNATDYPPVKNLLNKLTAHHRDSLVTVLIRNPWDLKLIPPGVTVIDAAGFRQAQIESALNLIFKL